MADDFRFGISGSIVGVDLNQLLVEHPSSTYFMRVASDTPEFGLEAEDVVIVDRSLPPLKNNLVVAVEAGERELKITRFNKITNQMELWGVVSYIIKKVRQ